MGVYLGTVGQVQIRREAGEQLLVTRLDPNDVNVTRKRFSVDFALSSLITGDHVAIATLDGSPLKLVSGHQDTSNNYYPDWSGYVHVDDVGGLRLYNTFAHALTGGSTNALTLVQPDSAVDVSFKTDDSKFNLLGQVSNFELTTSRDQVNTDVLGTEFHSYFEAGLISGQGTLSCFWEHKRTSVQSDSAADSEFSSYLARLLLRLKQGAAFEGRFYLYSGVNGGEPIYYESECLVTSFAVTVRVDQVIDTRIEFVATGPISLRQGFTPDALLQEDGNKILQEDGNTILLSDPE
jgi:hypothetical protein|tara:strand:- start:353 stop:1231 length:879 start_codon:yes stop_codon:yes gene_type:complete